MQDFLIGFDGVAFYRLMLQGITSRDFPIIQATVLAAGFLYIFTSLVVDILYAYPEWSSAAVFEAGRCFERLEELGQARKQFQTVVDRYEDSRWARMATDRLAQLSSANTLPGR